MRHVSKVFLIVQKRHTARTMVGPERMGLSTHQKEGWLIGRQPSILVDPFSSLHQ